MSLKQLKKILTQQYFFTDLGREFYDHKKIEVFNMMYCGGDDEFKTEVFFELTQTQSKTVILNGS